MRQEKSMAGIRRNNFEEPIMDGVHSAAFDSA
jgi:hypothetical protein